MELQRWSTLSWSIAFLLHGLSPWERYYISRSIALTPFVYRLKSLEFIVSLVQSMVARIHNIVGHKLYEIVGKMIQNYAHLSDFIDLGPMEFCFSKIISHPHDMVSHWSAYIYFCICILSSKLNAVLLTLHTEYFLKNVENLDNSLHIFQLSS